MKFYDDPNSASTWMVAFISVLVLIVTILFLQVVYYGVLKDEVIAKRPTSYPVDQERQTQIAQIEQGVRWVDKDAGIVGMPIEMAMDQVVASRQGSEGGR